MRPPDRGRLPTFQSTLPTRGSDLVRCYADAYNQISIHAPHEGERRQDAEAAEAKVYISIHAPHEGERRGPRPRDISGDRDFNPRSPRGGATLSLRSARRQPCDFNPRSPRGGATALDEVFKAAGKFQSTLPTRGSDTVCIVQHTCIQHFNPRSPRGGATMTS